MNDKINQETILCGTADALIDHFKRELLPRNGLYKVGEKYLMYPVEVDINSVNKRRMDNKGSPIGGGGIYDIGKVFYLVAEESGEYDITLKLTGQFFRVLPDDTEMEDAKTVGSVRTKIQEDIVEGRASLVVNPSNGMVNLKYNVQANEGDNL